MIDVHISLVAKIAFICFLKSLCSFSPFVTFCHSGHVILAVTGCGLHLPINDARAFCNAGVVIYDRRVVAVLTYLSSILSCLKAEKHASDRIVMDTTLLPPYPSL